MKRIALSERFGHIKAVVDSTESDTDFSDNELIPKVSTKSFKYCDTPKMPPSGLLVKNKDHDDVNSETEMFEMEPQWMVLYKKILKKSRNQSGSHMQKKGASVCVAPLHNRWPLECLKTTLDQYNKQSQGSVSNSVSDDLKTDNVTIERNETELDICEEIVEEIDSKFIEKPVGGNAIEQPECIMNRYPLVNSRLMDKGDGTQIDKIITDTEESVENHNKMNTSDQAFKDLYFCKSEDRIRLHAKGDAAFDTESHSDVEVNEIIEEATSKKDDSSIETLAERNPQNTDITEITNTVVSSDALSQKNSMKGNETSVQVQPSSSNPVTELVKEKETDQLSICIETTDTAKNKSHEKNMKFSEESDKTIEISCAVSSKKTRSSDRIKDMSRKAGKHQIYQENNKEKADMKANDVLEQSDNNEKDTSYIVLCQSKNLSKVKTLEIKRAMSFPLDELLPSSPTILRKKRKAVEDIPATEIAVIQRKRHTSETCENNCDYVPKDVSFAPVPSSIIEGDVFHGTVYESSPEENMSNRNLDGSESITIPACPSSTQTCDHLDERDIGMVNLLTALQNGNQQVIAMFQAALHDQIGSNLEALAYKARQNYSHSPIEHENQARSLFGFYAEQAEKTEQEPNAAGDNATGEKYDELLHLLVEQCSALVKTDEDRCKLKSLLKVLRKEGEKKFTSTGFTPPHEIEINPLCNELNDTGEGLHQESGPEGSTCSETSHLTELFEGRTLLKGGVKPRHIPKTKVNKAGQNTPKDPRANLRDKNRKSLMKLPLPEFAVELYGEKKVKQILHLDWGLIRNLSVSVNEKDPRVNKAPFIGSNLKLIVDATKSLLENLQVSQENLTTEYKVEEDDNIESTGDTQGLAIVRTTDQETPETVKTVLNIKDVESDGRYIPVLITDSTKETHTRAILTKSRNSVLHTIDTAKGSNEFVNLDKKARIGVVKPLVEQVNTRVKEIKPSVGIVKPIQVNSSKTPEAELKKNNKISPSGTNRQSVSMELDSDIEDGEIGTAEDIQSKDGSKTKTNFETMLSSAKIVSKMAVDKRTGDKNGNKETYSHKKGTDSSKVIIISDDSGSEDGEIDNEIETAFIKKVSGLKKDTRVCSRDEYRSSRNYRKRERSSSISSVDSRISYSSRAEGRHYFKGSASRHHKSNRRDRSQSKNRSRLRGQSEDSSSPPRYRHRRRHHTSKDERSFRDSADSSGTVKRHHSLGDSKRKRHRTEEDRTSIVSDVTLTDEEISEEYRARFGNSKTRVSHSSSGDRMPESYCPGDWMPQGYCPGDRMQQGYCPGDRMPQGYFPGDRMLQGYCPVGSGAEYDKASQKIRKPRRKSFEEKQKEVQEDKKFLESCKQKFVGKSCTVSSTAVPVQKVDFMKSRQGEQTKPTAAGGLSFTDMLHLADLEDGEI